MEQDHNEQTQDSEEVIPDVLPDREMDVFLNKVHKKKVSNEIRQRRQGKKLQAQEPLPIPPFPQSKISKNQNTILPVVEKTFLTLSIVKKCVVNWIQSARKGKV